MKAIIHIAIIGAAAFLFSCASSKKVTQTVTDASQSYVDTTKAVTDTSTHKRTNIDTTKTVGTAESCGVIKFVEGGGKVSIDPAGNVTIEGVRQINAGHKSTIEQNRGVTQNEESTAGHSEQLNGVTAEQTKQENKKEEKQPAQKWYETTFARIGQGVCIAALLWLIFLYRKRKK